MTEPRDLEKTPHESNQPTPVPVRRTKWEKLGTYNILVLALGTIAILLSIAFLAFVWDVSIYRSTRMHKSSLWVAIVRSEWTARVVTLTTVVIRTATAAQLCVFAAIMAALILERTGTTATDFPTLSMIRCANTGPQALIWHAFHTIPNLSQLGFSAIIAIAILNALVLQFTSTILLADFGENSNITFSDNATTLPWGFKKTENYSILPGSDFWKTAQTTYPSFAEYGENWTMDETSTDTDKTYRGFLPFQNSTIRQNLRSYSGPMTVVDERVVCVQPKLSNTSLSGVRAGGNIARWTSFTIGGNIDINNTHRDVIQGNYGRRFNCTPPASGTGGEWSTTICYLEKVLHDSWGESWTIHQMLVNMI